MSKNNLFDGDSYKAIFAGITYKLLIGREWIKYADVMAKFNGLSSVKELKHNVSDYDYYGELKKAFPAVCDAIKESAGSDSIETQGNKKNKSFRYVGEERDPLADMINAKAINDLRQYWQFCQDSAGFFPTSWLEHFFNGSQDLLQMRAKKRRGEQVINADHDRQQDNIDLLPGLYENIINHNVLSITYQPYDEEASELVFHPHNLKEYNGRWFLFGHAEGREPENGYNLALDRIVGKPQVIKEKQYISPPSGFYTEYFKNIVGVSRIEGNVSQPIRIRAHNHYIYKLTETKKIHPSQEVVIPFGKHEDGEYGDFVVNVELNNEFIGRILQMGAGLEIISPDEIRNVFKERINSLYRLYEPTEKG